MTVSESVTSMCTTDTEEEKYYLNVFFESHQRVHPFGLSETRLKSHIPSEGLSLPHHSLIRKDAARSQQVRSLILTVLGCRMTY